MSTERNYTGLFRLPTLDLPGEIPCLTIKFRRVTYASLFVLPLLFVRQLESFALLRQSEILHHVSRAALGST